MCPVNADFLKSKGNDFGKQTDPESLLYNGPLTKINYSQIQWNLKRTELLGCRQRLYR